MAYQRGWCFTINNYTEDDVKQVESLPKYKHLFVGKEVGEQGTPHLQGYVSFLNKIRFEQVKKLLTRAHITAAKGTARDNYNYCMKENDPLISTAEPTNLESVYQVAKEFASKKRTYAEICEFDSRFYAESNKKLYMNAVDTQPVYRGPKRIYWLYGDTGTGKSRFAEEMGAKLFCFNNQFAQNYERASVVCIDELRHSDLSFSKLLLLLDPYRPSVVNIKGGQRTWDPEVVYVTTTIPPWEWMTDGTANEQLLRRISSISMFTHHNE